MCGKDLYIFVWVWDGLDVFHERMFVLLRIFDFASVDAVITFDLQLDVDLISWFDFVPEK